MNHAFMGDITVTQDIGLASTLLPKGVHVLSPRGTLFDEMIKPEYKLLLTCAIKMLKQEEGVYIVKVPNLFILKIGQNLSCN